MANPDCFLDDFANQDTFDDLADEGDGISEEVAENLYNAYMTHETAKQRYRESSKLRGSDPEAMRKLAAEKLKLAKARSFCSGCRRRGHWHEDAECPLNKGSGGGARGNSTAGAAAGNGTASKREIVKDNFPCHVVHVTWDLSETEAEKLLAITDTACSKSVAGSGWVDSYVEEAKRQGCTPEFVSCKEAFRFGASKVFRASYAVVICFCIGKFKVALKVAVVNGEVPLLVSRPALGQLGMVMDIAENTATFKKLNMFDMELRVTETAHPAFPIVPAALPKSCRALSNEEGPELQIFLASEQYMEGELSSEPKFRAQPLVSDTRGDPGIYSECAVSWMTTSTHDMSTDTFSDDVATRTSPRVLSRPDPEHEPEQELPTTPKPVANVFYPKKIAATTKNLLLDDAFNAESFTN